MNELPKSPPILFFCSLLEIDAELVGGEMLWLFWLGPSSLFVHRQSVLLPHIAECRNTGATRNIKHPCP